jgi:hypothetical protein
VTNATAQAVGTAQAVTDDPAQAAVTA